MTPVEFIEALGRVADKITRPMPDFFPEMPCFIKSRLDKKIESLLCLLMKTALLKPQSEVLEKGLKKIYDEELADPVKKKYRNESRQFDYH